MCNVRGGVLPTWRAPPSAPLNNLHSCSIKRRSRFLIRTCLICFPGCRRAQQHAEGNHAHCVGPLKENCKQPSAIGSSQGCASRRARVRGWPESMRSTVLQNIAAEEWPLAPGSVISNATTGAHFESRKVDVLASNLHTYRGLNAASSLEAGLVV